MTTPFLGTLRQHPTGVSHTTFQKDESCEICANSKLGERGVIPESCLHFSTTNPITRLFQEFARAIPCLSWTLRSRGESRHIFHENCLRDWTSRNQTCPYDRKRIHVDSFLTMGQKLVQEICNKPKSWTAIAGGISAIGGVFLGLAFGLSTKEADRVGMMTGATGAVAVQYFVHRRRQDQ